MHLVTYLHPRLPTDSAEEPKIMLMAYLLYHIGMHAYLYPLIL